MKYRTDKLVNYKLKFAVNSLQRNYIVSNGQHAISYNTNTDRWRTANDMK